ncbi:MAG TPA: DUF2520 domain-containing protein [Acidimicrobiia bacterium]|nr:DUF2520 domain-containing protein [Acidimicrobiia bacterium]
MSDSQSARTFALVGPGRAGTSVALLLVARGWRAVAVAGRTPGAPSTRTVAARLHAPASPAGEAGRGAALVVVAAPDGALEDAAAALVPGLEPGALVVHLSGARTLAALEPVARLRPDCGVGSLHPLQTLPSPDAGVARLPGSWAAVAGPDSVAELAVELGLRPFRVDDADRALYHAAAAVAANHVVALVGQVERLARAAGVPFEAFVPLVRASLDNAAELGPAAALTGPVARGDLVTVARHLDALPAPERPAYAALAELARRLARRDDADLRRLLASAAGGDGT